MRAHAHTCHTPPAVHAAHATYPTHCHTQGTRGTCSTHGVQGSCCVPDYKGSAATSGTWSPQSQVPPGQSQKQLPPAPGLPPQPSTSPPPPTPQPSQNLPKSPGPCPHLCCLASSGALLTTVLPGLEPTGSGRSYCPEGAPSPSPPPHNLLEERPRIKACFPSPFLERENVRFSVSVAAAGGLEGE